MDMDDVAKKNAEQILILLLEFRDKYGEEYAKCANAHASLMVLMSMFRETSTLPEVVTQNILANAQTSQAIFVNQFSNGNMVLGKRLIDDAARLFKLCCVIHDTETDKDEKNEPTKH